MSFADNAFAHRRDGAPHHRGRGPDPATRTADGGAGDRPAGALATCWFLLACALPAFVTAAILYDAAASGAPGLRRTAIAAPVLGVLVAVPLVAWRQRRAAAETARARRAVHGLCDQLRRISLQSSALRLSQGLIRDLRAGLRDIEQNVVWIDEALPDPRADGLDACASRLQELAGRCRRRLDHLAAAVESVEFRHVVVEQDVNGLLAELTDLLGWEFYQAGIDVRLDLQEELPPVRGNRQRLRQVFQVLLLNALAAVGPGGTVRVTSRRAVDRIEVVVADNGPGIAPEHLDRVFDPLFTTRSDGLGLGLTVGRDTVEGMGGTLVADSASGRGARFVVRIPLPPDGAPPRP